MPYFTAVLVRAAGRWRTRDLAVESGQALDELVDALRDLSPGGEPVLAVVEREDAWFALVRVDGDEDARVFVSDAEAVGVGPYRELLAVDLESLDEAEEVDPAAPWGGDLAVLEDLGTAPARLRELVGEDGPTPGEALSEIAESAGFADLLDGLR